MLVPTRGRRCSLHSPKTRSWTELLHKAQALPGIPPHGKWEMENSTPLGKYNGLGGGVQNFQKERKCQTCTMATESKFTLPMWCKNLNTFTTQEAQGYCFLKITDVKLVWMIFASLEYHVEIIIHSTKWSTVRKISPQANQRTSTP